MAFKDKHDVWTEEEDNLTGWGLLGWTLVTLFLLPWLFGVGFLICKIMNL